MASNAENPPTSAQYAAQYDAQYEQAQRHVFDEERDADWRDPRNDVPIPFGVDVEQGAAIEEIDPRGLVT